MCGIFGLVVKRGIADSAVVNRLTDLVAHRGPDGRGVVVRRNIGLGHRRLSILDLSDDGQQPMWHVDGGLCITYNGEIYNYLELRAELDARGHAFHTRTDTEVILAAYREWGSACVQRFNGMWAFAILDQPERKLFCSRDRFGVKPFHWIDTADQFAFASEIGQLLPLCPSRTADADAVRDFLISGLTDHTPGTFFRGVSRLEAGHNLTYDLDRNQLRIERYYELAPANVPDDYLAAVERFGALLSDAVHLRLRSDVRVGTCLSGGLDSSSIATIAADVREPTAGPFVAITAISEQPDNSEEAFAQQVVEASGLEWLRVRPDFDDFADTLSDVVTTQAEPFGGPSVSMQYFVMQAARAHETPVLLDGQGGDETLFGYDRHYAALLRYHLRRGGTFGLLAAARGALAHNGNLSFATLAGMLIGSFWPALIERRMVPRMGGFRRPRQLPPAWAHYLEKLGDSVAVQRADICRTSLPMLLRFEDRNSMRHSIETRLPFLDYRLVEYTLAMPLDLKMREGWTKWPLRSVMSGRMPNSIVWRSRKLGFEAPDRTWLSRLAGAMAAEVARSALLHEFFDSRCLGRLYPSLDRRLQWRMFSLASWEACFGVAEVA